MAESNRALTLRTILLMVLVVLVFPLLPLLISGQWGWWEAWAYALLSTLGFILSRALAVRRHPDILAERSRSIELQGAKAWDRILAPAVAFGSVAILVMAGLDRLHGWTLPYAPAVRVAALLVIVLGYGLGTWALLENRFFSGVVRIQTDRGHQVVTSGPYRWVRHPGYAGTLWVGLALPLLLDSNWAFIPAVLLFGLLVLRTALEDRTLQAELPGYAAYAQSTRYRLFPGLW